MRKKTKGRGGIGQNNLNFFDISNVLPCTFWVYLFPSGNLFMSKNGLDCIHLADNLVMHKWTCKILRTSSNETLRTNSTISIYSYIANIVDFVDAFIRNHTLIRRAFMLYCDNEQISDKRFLNFLKFPQAFYLPKTRIERYSNFFIFNKLKLVHC